MSKLLDKLEKLSRGVPMSLGFGAASRSEKPMAMALLGMLSTNRQLAQKTSTLAKIGADGILFQGIEVDKVVNELTKSLGDVPWGMKVDGLNDEQASHYKEQGCDFLAFGPENALLGALGDEDTGYILCIQPDMDERSLRALEDVPVDVVFLPSDSITLPLTVQQVIALSSVRGMFSKYFMLEVPGPLSSKELEGLRDLGVDGLVVDAGALSVKELEDLKSSLSNLPKKQRDKTHRPAALLPSTPVASPSAPSHEEEEEEEDSF